jgi:hypothetical protein
VQVSAVVIDRGQIHTWTKQNKTNKKCLTWTNKKFCIVIVRFAQIKA